jgi:hypothetical protein
VDPESLNPDPDTDPDRIRIQGFDDQKLGKKYSRFFFFDQKLQFTFVQATGEAFSPQKRTSSKKGNLLTFFYVCESFLPSWIGIRIQGPH